MQGPTIPHYQPSRAAAKAAAKAAQEKAKVLHQPSRAAAKAAQEKAKVLRISKNVNRLMPMNGILGAENRVPNIHKLTKTENLWKNRVKSQAQAQAQEKLEPVKYKGLFLCCASEPNSIVEIDFNDI